MSKGKTNKRVKAAAAIPTRSAPKATTEKHKHTWPRDLAKVKGKRVRDVCPCGYTDSWRRMTESEKSLYGITDTPGTRELPRKVELYSYGPDINGLGTIKSVTTTSEPKEKAVEAEDKFSKVRALLGKTKDNAQAAVTDKAHATAAEAGVEVSDQPTRKAYDAFKIKRAQWEKEQRDKYPAELLDRNDHSPAKRREGATHTEIVAAARSGKLVPETDVQGRKVRFCGELTYHPEHPWKNDTKFCVGHLQTDLPDRDDHSETVVLEDYDVDFDLKDWDDQPYLIQRRVDVCYLMMRNDDTSYVWKYLLPRKRAHAELSKFLKDYPNGAHAIGDAKWDYGAGEWFYPKDALDFLQKNGVSIGDVSPAQVESCSDCGKDVDTCLGHEEDEDDYAERDMVWLITDDFLEVLDRFDAESEAWGALNDGKAVRMGDAVWNEDTEDWEVSEDDLIKHGFAKNDDGDGYHKATTADLSRELGQTLDLIDEFVDTKYTEEVLEAKLEKIVADAYVDDEPSIEEQAKNPDRFHIELDFGNDDRMGYANNNVGDLARDLSKRKRNDLEFAARKLGIKGVTTKVQKDILICALVAAADTTLVKEHALNRAALIIQWEGKVSGREEWERHYGLQAATDHKPVHHHDDPEA